MATQVVMCDMCPKEFDSEVRVNAHPRMARHEAAKYGWHYDFNKDKDYCPSCWLSRRDSNSQPFA